MAERAAEAAEAAPAAAASAATSTIAPASSGTAPLQRIHILPFLETEAKMQSRSRLEAITPELRRLRSEQEILRMGDIIRCEDLEFAVIKCEPLEGLLDSDTDFFLEGAAIVCFEKIQFNAWGPAEKSAETLLSEYFAPYFEGDFAPYGSTDAKRMRIFHVDQVLQFGDTCVQVVAAEPDGLGVLSYDTDIFTRWDTTPEFEKIHVVPFQDTLPRAYDFDIFYDYLKPYLDKFRYKKFQENDLFTFQSVQFKIVACEPNVIARVGKGTTIFCEGVLYPSLRNLLTPDLLNQVAQLPLGLQMLLLNTERTTRELEEMLTNRHGLFEDTLESIETFTWPPPPGERVTQHSCMICLGDFLDDEQLRRLPCRHVFHTSCVDEWLRRCTDCPICKDNVDRSIRQY